MSWGKSDSEVNIRSWRRYVRRWDCADVVKKQEKSNPITFYISYQAESWLSMNGDWKQFLHFWTYLCVFKYVYVQVCESTCVCRYVAHFCGVQRTNLDEVHFFFLNFETECLSPVCNSLSIVDWPDREHRDLPVFVLRAGITNCAFIPWLLHREILSIELRSSNFTDWGIFLVLFLTYINGLHGYVRNYTTFPLWYLDHKVQILTSRPI